MAAWSSTMDRNTPRSYRGEEILSGLGTGELTLKDTMMSLAGNLMAIGHSTATDQVVKNTFANFAFEHYEIAAYKSLLTLADVITNSAGQSLLQTSLQEEQAMADWIEQLIGPTTLRYVERTAAGMTAGV